MKSLKLVLTVGLLTMVPSVSARAVTRPAQQGTIAFSRQTNDGFWHLFTIAPDGTGERQLTFASANDVASDWSPDGTRIAFSRCLTGSLTSRMWIIAADGTGAMMSLGRGRSPQWSPSGRRIVFGNFGRAAGQLWFERPDGSRRHGKALDVCDTSNGAGWPTDWFGSGGGGILFVWGCDPDIPGGSIWKVHSDASDPQLILANVDYDSYQDARMSPDGATVAWGRNVFGSDGGSADIGRIGALGNGYYTQWQDTTCEPFDRPCDAGYPSWSPTGNRLAYGFVNGDRISWIATMDPTDQGSPTMVIEGIRPVWS